MPKNSNRMTRSNAIKKSTKKPKAKAMPKKKRGAARSRPEGYAGRTNVLFKQESLGGQTQNTLKLVPLKRPDSRARYIKAVSAPSTFNGSADALITSSTSGLQAVGTFILCPQADLRQIADSLQNYLYSGSPSSATPVNAPARFLLQTAQDVFDFANRSSAPVTLKLHVVKCKRDTWYNSEQSCRMQYNSPNGLTVYWNGAPDDAFRAGVQAQSVPFQVLSANDDWLNPGILPTQSAIFNQYFSIEKTVEVQLAQGGVHQLTLDSYYDKVIDASLYANTPLVGIMGVTRFLMYTAIGAPVIEGGTNNITTAVVDLGCIRSTKYKFTQTSSPVPALFQDGSELAQVTYNNTVQINPGSGGSQAVVTA